MKQGAPGEINREGWLRSLTDPNRVFPKVAE